MLNWLGGIAAWLSQGVNCVLLAGSPDMTVSARCHINQHRPRWRTARKAINTLAFWQKDHCKTSFQSDVMYAVTVLTHHKNGKMLSDNLIVGQSET